MALGRCSRSPEQEPGAAQSPLKGLGFPGVDSRPLQGGGRGFPRRAGGAVAAPGMKEKRAAGSRRPWAGSKAD